MSKAADAFRTISEVAEDLDIPQHVLRFWETRFTSIRPLKRGGGRRYYRPDDVELLRGIRHLLYGQGYTIKGVQRILKEDGARAVQDVGRTGSLPVPSLPGSAFTDGETSAPRAESSAPRPPEAWDDDPTVPLSAPASGISGAELDQLRAALAELHECQRVLETLRRR